MNCLDDTATNESNNALPEADKIEILSSISYPLPGNLQSQA